MKLFFKGFVTSGIIFFSFILLTGSIFLEDDPYPYNINKKPGRYQFARGVDWRKNDISTWVDTQNGIAIVSYIDSNNEKQIMVSTFLENLEKAKNNSRLD